MGQSSTSGSGSSYSLVGGDQSELRQYANSQVEIRGTLESNSSSSSGAGTGAAGAGGTGASSTGGGSMGSTGTGASPSTTGGGMASSSGGQTLRVSSVRQVSASCSGGR